MAFADAQTGAVVKEFSLPVRITLAGTVSKGDILGYSSGWVRALATVSSVVQGRLVAGEDGVSGDVIVAYRKAVVSGRYSGGTAGAIVYVAEGSDAGEITETAPSTTNDANTPIGIMADETTAILTPGERADSLAS